MQPANGTTFGIVMSVKVDGICNYIVNDKEENPTFCLASVSQLISLKNACCFTWINNFGSNYFQI